LASSVSSTPTNRFPSTPCGDVLAAPARGASPRQRRVGRGHGSTRRCARCGGRADLAFGPTRGSALAILTGRLDATRPRLRLGLSPQVFGTTPSLLDM